MAELLFSGACWITQVTCATHEDGRPFVQWCVLYYSSHMRYTWRWPTFCAVVRVGLHTLHMRWGIRDMKAKTFRMKNSNSFIVQKLHTFIIHLVNVSWPWRLTWTRLASLAFISFLVALSRKRIDLSSMLGVYVVMGVGMLVAFMTLIGEIFWNRREKKKLNNKTQRFVAWNFLLNNGNIFLFSYVKINRKRVICPLFNLPCY